LEQAKKINQELFQKVGSAITSNEKIDNLLTLVIESMNSALEAESGLLMLWEKEEDRVRSKLACGFHQEELLQLVVKRGEGVFGWVVENGQTLIMTSSDSAGGQTHSTAMVIPYRSLLCVPLIHQARVLGLLGVINKKQGDGFVKDDEVLLRNVGNQVAVAIENARLSADAERTYFETISALAMAVEAKDTYTVGHLQRVSDYVERLARQMGFSDEKMIRIIKDGAFLHDIGKIACPDHVLLKPGKLTTEEMAIMRTHTTVGESIIAPLSSFKELRAIVRHHQEWYDGTGYPDQLKGENIPIGARLLSVADVYDALTTNRPYRKALSHEVAMKMICDEAGTHFDPKIVQAFIKMME
jgi:HD-GYP domain-containing protein (c-di-GMP phosphodiesterase class II)